MRRRTREIIVLLFVLAGIALGVFAYFWFSGHIEGGRRRNVTVFFDDVTGLRVGDPVEVFGIPKGRVASIALDGRRVRCRVSIDRDVRLTGDTRFAIRSVSYLGSDRYLMVTLGSGEAIGESHVFEGQNEALDLEETFLRLDRMIDKLNPEELGENLRAAAADLMATIDGQLSRFNSEVGRFNGSFAEAVDEVEHLSGNLDSLAALLKSESTAGRLFTSPELYDEVCATSRQLQELIADIRQNPRRYFKISVF